MRKFFSSFTSKVRFNYTGHSLFLHYLLDLFSFTTLHHLLKTSSQGNIIWPCGFFPLPSATTFYLPVWPQTFWQTRCPEVAQRSHAVKTWQAALSIEEVNPRRIDSSVPGFCLQSDKDAFITDGRRYFLARPTDEHLLESRQWWKPASVDLLKSFSAR